MLKFAIRRSTSLLLHPRKPTKPELDSHHSDQDGTNLTLCQHFAGCEAIHADNAKLSGARYGHKFH